MAFISARKSRGRAYWSICESRRIDGKPRNIILEYLGTAETLLKRLHGSEGVAVKTYSHGGISVLLQTAIDLDIVSLINEHIPVNRNGDKPKRDHLTVGASLMLAAVGRACRPTSKMAWYEWCKSTSLEYCLKYSFKKLDSQHFWDQMDCLPVEKIELIEESIIKGLVERYELKLDLLFYDTTNFFTFIDSKNEHCSLPQRGKNKQKRIDLRQVGLALLVEGRGLFPMFHRVYDGNKNDVTVFADVFKDLLKRLKGIVKELSDITLVFDKGNNSKENFKSLDTEKIAYVAGLVSAYFKDLIKEANRNFTTITIDGEEISVYRLKKTIWGQKRTCVVTISSQLKEGQVQGINQHLNKKYKVLELLKRQLENPRRRKRYDREDIEERLKKIIKGQFIEDILRYNIIELQGENYSFTYYLDEEAFKTLKKEVLGRKIIVTNRHDWNTEEILKAYRGQSNVEFAFRHLKNPCHLTVRPQYHWTDQKIQVHVFICILGYLLTMAAYAKARKQANYKRSPQHFLQDLEKIRLACLLRGKKKNVRYQLEEIPKNLKKLANLFNLSDNNIRKKIKISDYN